MSVITLTGLLYASVPVFAAILLLAVLKLGQVRPLLIAMVRLTLQITLLGFVLEWLFGTRSAVIVVMIAMLMLAVSAHTVGSRLPRGRWALRIEAFLAIGLTTVFVMAISLKMALNLEPWYTPKVVIPLLGMILGNSVTAVALAAERFESELKADRDRVELRLALGASGRQAATPALRSAVRAALTPIINNMMIAGIVAIPGMTTGQLLAGARVADAVRYQVLIYFGITATVALSTIILLFARLRRYFTPWAQLRLEAISGTEAV
jgi:putative ABC transport system permease protein